MAKQRIRTKEGEGRRRKVTFSSYYKRGRFRHPQQILTLHCCERLNKEESNYFIVSEPILERLIELRLKVSKVLKVRGYKLSEYLVSTRQHMVADRYEPTFPNPVACFCALSYFRPFLSVPFFCLPYLRVLWGVDAGASIELLEERENIEEWQRSRSRGKHLIKQ